MVDHTAVRLYMLFLNGVDAYRVMHEVPREWRMFYFAMADAYLMDKELEAGASRRGVPSSGTQSSGAAPRMDISARSAIKQVGGQ